MNYEDKCNAVIKDVIKLAQGGATPTASDYDLAVAWNVFDGEEVICDNGDSKCLPFYNFYCTSSKSDMQEVANKLRGLGVNADKVSQCLLNMKEYNPGDCITAVSPRTVDAFTGKDTDDLGWQIWDREARFYLDY